MQQDQEQDFENTYLENLEIKIIISRFSKLEQAGDINRSSASSEQTTITKFYLSLQVYDIAYRCGDSVVYRLAPCLAIKQVVGSMLSLPISRSNFRLDAKAFLPNEA